MPLVFLVLGILLLAAGVVAVGFGIPINDLSFGNTLILAGTTSAVGGFLLLGLAAVVSELSQIAQALRGRPAARPAPSPEPAVQTQPATEIRAQDRQPVEVRPPVEASAVDVSTSAIERLRSNMPRPDRVVPEAETVPLSPNGGQAVPQSEPLPSQAQPAGPTAVETLREPRLDFLVRQRPSPRAAPPEAFDVMWPKRTTREPQRQAEEPAAVAATPVKEAPEPVAPPAPLPSAAPPIEDAAHSVAVLKSGVVDGMAYTLYADGSIEAQLPQGTVRFGSIAELRAHIENHS